MGISEIKGPAAADRRALCGRGWLHGQPEAFRAALLDRCTGLELGPGESAIHLGDEAGGLFGFVEAG